MPKFNVIATINKHEKLPFYMGKCFANIQNTVDPWCHTIQHHSYLKKETENLLVFFTYQVSMLGCFRLDKSLKPSSSSQSKSRPKCFVLKHSPIETKHLRSDVWGLIRDFEWLEVFCLFVTEEIQYHGGLRSRELGQAPILLCGPNS